MSRVSIIGAYNTKFGAFVMLAPGIDGLIHVSRFARSKDEIKAGDQITVTVKELDLDRRRIALAPAEGEGGDTAQEDTSEAEELRKKYVSSGTGSKKSGSLGTLGDALRQQMEKKKKTKS